jgi:hypothetical protein
MRRGGVRAQAVVYRKFFKSAWLSDALLPLIKIGLLHPTRRKTCSRHSTTYRHFDFDRSCRCPAHIRLSHANHWPTLHHPLFLRTACRRTNLRRNSYFHIRGYRRGCLSETRFSRLEHGDITTEPGCTKMTYQQAWKAYLSSAAHVRLGQ